MKVWTVVDQKQNVYSVFNDYYYCYMSLLLHVPMCLGNLCVCVCVCVFKLSGLTLLLFLCTLLNSS